MLNRLSFWQVFLKDTDERACAYIAGPAPNRWGFTYEGEDLYNSINEISLYDGKFLESVSIKSIEYCMYSKKLFYNPVFYLLEIPETESWEALICSFRFTPIYSK